MGKEHLATLSRELSPELQAAFTSIFVSRTDCYPVQKGDGSYRSIPNPLLPQILSAHFRGLITLGTYALDRRSDAKWMCLDADTDETWSQLRDLSVLLSGITIPTYLESSRRGGHAWFFFDIPLSGEDTRRFARQLLAQYMISNVEIYPKQDRLQTGSGSLMRLPLGIHQLTQTVYPFIAPNGTPIAPTIREQVEILSTPKRVPKMFVTHVLKQAALEPRMLPSRPFIKRDAPIYGKTPSERIKNRMSVPDFISRYVDLDEAGHGLCPFHDDHVNSFSVNAERNYWHCFAGCGGGSIIDFWMKWRELNAQDGNFKASVTDLARMLLK